MRVQNLKNFLLTFLFVLTLFSACKKEEEQAAAAKIEQLISGKPGGGTTTPPLTGPILEAEMGTLAGGAVAVADVNRSGGYFVEQNSGSVSFQVSIPTDAFYNIYINAASPFGEKTNVVTVDAMSSNFTTPANASYVDYKIVTSIKLTAGTHTIAINNSWGYIQIDLLKLEAIDPASRFNINTSLVTVGATSQANNLYQFLRNNYSKKILSGVMNKAEVDWLKLKTGKEPALMGNDFGFINRGYTWYDNNTPVQEAKTWWDRNGITAFTWHWRDPSRITEEFYSANTQFDVSKILIPSSPEYNAMISDIDYLAGLLSALQTQNVPVIWRPLHEAAGGWFWWGAKGPEPCKKLWQIMYDRLVNHHGLKNLIWVWTREPNDEAWYPGDAYVDIIGKDIYSQGNHSSQAIEFNNINSLYGGKKMVAMTETGSNPDPNLLVADSAGWSWFMTWDGEYTRNSTWNTLNQWKAIMNHSYVITLDEMPSLK
ncbi:glycosyl hydrolase [Pedobacter sp. P351]|uniref:glycosyl hydrolase n=1 Tax=Pedobacter superstes TaxID=3133441 RepID=UPI0030957C50